MFTFLKVEIGEIQYGLKPPPSAIMRGAAHEISEIYSFLILMFGSHLWRPEARAKGKKE